MTTCIAENFSTCSATKPDSIRRLRAARRWAVSAIRFVLQSRASSTCPGPRTDCNSLIALSMTFCNESRSSAPIID